MNAQSTAAQVATAAKRKRRATSTVNVDEGTLSFKFGDGDSAPAFTVPVHELSGAPWTTLSEMQRRLILHGAKQKLADGYSDPDSDPEHEVRAGWAELVAGQWTARGEGAPRTTLLAEAILALAQESGDESTTLEDVQAFLDAAGTDENGNVDEEKRKAELKSLRAEPQIKAKMAQIEAKRKADRAKELAKSAKAAPKFSLQGLVKKH